MNKKKKSCVCNFFQLNICWRNVQMFLLLIRRESEDSKEVLELWINRKVWRERKCGAIVVKIWIFFQKSYITKVWFENRKYCLLIQRFVEYFLHWITVKANYVNCERISKIVRSFDFHDEGIHIAGQQKRATLLLDL